MQNFLSLYFTFSYYHVHLLAVKLFALDDSLHALRLYMDLRNEDEPSERDPAAWDPKLRRRICRNLTDYGLSSITEFDSVNSMEILAELHFPEHSELLDQIFSPIDMNAYYEYTNAYTSMIFFFGMDVPSMKEYVFFCIMRSRAGNLIPFFVSKEYNVGPHRGLFYKPGRFIFFSPVYHMQLLDHNTVILAEEPAIAHTDDDDDDFNVEIYFLRMKKYVRQAESDHIDPLCKLISNGIDDPANQHYRLCVAVSTSAYFWTTLRYPSQMPSACRPMEVSFRTSAAKREAAGKSYYERMALCMCESDRSDAEQVHYLYISRAYQSNHVLVYEFDPLNQNIYLVNLSSNVSIADELNSFDFVED